ncbi:hypothetical protein AAFC00_005692 [Neodothiora populina]|uniref:RING-type E3 ubiquitin transferase n=1 Tax=Neodothiora populina TaxID=2781224 RepID=A0ABR3P5I8_9PEZI
MRPLRLVLSLSFCLVTILILSFFAASRTSDTDSVNTKRGRTGLGAYFNWQSSSLFPPSAIISLTDDNSTFFLARPANFGPPLPSRGLDGQLWIGSGFGDEIGRGVVAGTEGELGCSDVPGWGDGDYGSSSSGSGSSSSSSSSSGSGNSGASGSGGNGANSNNAGSSSGNNSPSRPKDDSRKSRISKSSSKKAATTPGKAARARRASDDDEQGDGTDDHLHHPLPPSNPLKTSPEAAAAGKKLAHADIQSLQETAEIAGKVVLLSRGGCGFLEKVKWVQRRGGVALIVGDNVRGGALVTMYARGDTSNVTIPSLFTSHTTAHLLSSLVPSGSFLDDVSPDEAARLGLLVGDKSTVARPGKTDAKAQSPGKQQQTQSDSGTDKSSKSKSASSHAGSGAGAKTADKQPSSPKSNKQQSEQGWFRSMFNSASSGGHQDTRRPPSSGKIGWIQQSDFEDDASSHPDSRTGKATSKSSDQGASAENSGRKPDQGFVIGVQDWRDPDLLDAQVEAAQNTPGRENPAGNSKPTAHSGPKGGSITPGSGEYEQSKKHPADSKASSPNHPTKHSDEANRDKKPPSDKPDRWLNRMGLSNEETSTSAPEQGKAPHVVTQVDEVSADKDKKKPEDGGDDDEHDGLWVTLTPTSMSSSPFFDTLLVLVISPLVTLTIVYALLLLRSRIRRRRWRAPKSVVERLPVRTYHTIPSTVTSNSTENSPPRSPTAPDSTTPLLQSGARPISQGRSRPRSRTEGEVPPTGTSFRGPTNSSIDPAQEKREAGLSEWRRRYVGRQKECVVCLEEYVDGVSRVMSLPCGHEFHAECISPWLTTRRRTCPICKSDVVRSIGRTGPSPSSRPLLHDSGSEDSSDEAVALVSDDLQEQVAETRNDDPSSTHPISREEEAFEDLERGLEEEEQDRSR